MKTTKFFTLLVAVISLFLLVGCSLFNNDSDGNTSKTDLQLLRIETTEGNGGYYPGGYGPISYVNRKTTRAVTTLAAKNTANQTANQIEEIESQTVSLVAVIKNENRASFIDMVVYNSQTGKTVVYNEGNGAYQCSSETVYEDEMWITKITFRVNVELTADNFYFEIKEIKFLRNNTDEKADLNTLDVRKKEFRFTTEYFDMTATQKIKQDLAFFENFASYYIEYDLTNKTVKIETGLYYVDDEEIIEIAYVAKKVEIIVPESLTLQYYENRVLKTGEFQVTELRIKDICGQGDKMIHTIGELTINVPITIDIEKTVRDLKYAEGTKICLAPEALFVYSSISFPSTCEEIDTNLELDRLTINYNGTMTEFRNIKGAEDLISHWESIEKAFQIVCTDGTISLSVN